MCLHLQEIVAAGVCIGLHIFKPRGTVSVSLLYSKYIPCSNTLSSTLQTHYRTNCCCITLHIHTHRMKHLLYHLRERKINRSDLFLSLCHPHNHTKIHTLKKRKRFACQLLSWQSPISLAKFSVQRPGA